MATAVKERAKKNLKKAGGQVGKISPMTYLGARQGKSARFPVSYIEPALKAKLVKAAEAADTSVAAFVTAILQKSVK